MVRIKPFRGLRPVTALAVKVASPPYDVLDSEEARIMAAGNPHAFLHITKPEIDLDPSIDLYDARVYQKGGENMRKFMNDGILVQDDQAMFYVYAQRMGTHYQIGLVAGASIDDYEADLIKKHELTRADKEDDRTRHIDVLDANTGPVFLTYKARKNIDAIINSVVAGTPVNDFVTPDGVGHTFWTIRDPNVNKQIEKAFAAIDCLYVADGHHRSASACRVRKMRRDANPRHDGNEEYNFFLSVIFPHDQMQIMAYNRAIKDLNGLSLKDFHERVSASFIIEKPGRPLPSTTKQFGMFTREGWVTLTPKEGTFDAKDPVASLDVQILQKNLFEPILAIGDPRKDKRISFIGGIRGTAELEKLVSSGQYAVAFSLYPTTIQQLMAIADAGKIMPPKSTWFEPKLRSGLVVHLLHD